MVYTANVELRNYLEKKGFKLIQNGTINTLYFTHLENKVQIKIDRVKLSINFFDSSGYKVKVVKSIKEGELNNFIEKGGFHV